MSLERKTVSGMMWSFAENLTNQGTNFIIGIVLARLLVPRDFGLIGMITIFIAISQSFIDSGFSQALIRKKNCTQADYSTVFYFNLIVGVVFYMLLFFSAGAISIFFKEPQLKLLVRVLGINLIINSLTIIQLTQLTKRIDFKLQTRISFLSAIGSGAASIILAFKGFGVWSLVAKSVGQYAFKSFLLWLWNGWKPSLLFDKRIFKEMFTFGSKLLASGLISTTFNNLYYLIIGRYFYADELGFYTRADMFQGLLSKNLSGIIQRVSYPVMSSIQDDSVKLKAAFRKLIRSTMLLSFILMFGLSAVAKSLIVVLIGTKWLPSVVYLQMLSLVYMLYPLHILNLNMLTVLGRSDLFLRLEILKNLIAFPIIIVAALFGIKIMILALLIITIISYYLNSFWSGRLIGYSTREQVKDVFPSFLIALSCGGITYITGILLNISNLMTLLIQIMVGCVFVFALMEILRFKDFLYLKLMIIEKIFNQKG